MSMLLASFYKKDTVIILHVEMLPEVLESGKKIWHANPSLLGNNAASQLGGSSPGETEI